MTAFREPPAQCFQGVTPAIIATASHNGIPNVTYLSQIVRVDEKTVALSCQFFNKTKQNVLENPFASAQLLDPLTFDGYRLDLRYLRSESSGPVFDAMALRIEVIASHTGMTGVFRLLSADIYEVIDCEKLVGLLVDDPSGTESAEAIGPDRTDLDGLLLVSERAKAATNLEGLFATVLESLEGAFGFAHSMFFIPDEAGTLLYTIASRGYGEEGAGAEIAMGDGLIGAVAKERRIVRVSSMAEDLRYGRAIRASMLGSESAGATPHGPKGRPDREIPLPGLSNARSQLALPLMVGERLLGVLAVESRERLFFDEWDEAFLAIVANQVALALDNVLLRGADVEEAPRGRLPNAYVAARSELPPRRFRFFKNDDCVFAGDQYLIRNVPGRILWKILRAHVDSGRTEFNNRELRLDPWVGLPAIRDNLESRLVLLRKRLEEKCSELRLVRTSRGHFRLEADCEIELEETDGT